MWHLARQEAASCATKCGILRRPPIIDRTEHKVNIHPSTTGGRGRGARPFFPNALFLVFLLVFSLPSGAQDKRYHGDGIDDYLQYVPTVAAFSLKLCGVEGASSWKRRLTNAVCAYALTTGTAWVLKQAVHERRPDGTDDHAFPSGHATVAFTGATVLLKEYGRVSPWIPVAGYALAAGVAADRVRRNRHRWGDVAAGAAIGVGGTLLGYWLGDRITGERSRLSVGAGPAGVALAWRL